ncbi:unnamed protein product, partial [Ectocarpus sp. 8 AP-2014]
MGGGGDGRQTKRKARGRKVADGVRTTNEHAYTMKQVNPSRPYNACTALSSADMNRVVHHLCLRGWRVASCCSCLFVKNCSVQLNVHLGMSFEPCVTHLIR